MCGSERFFVQGSNGQCCLRYGSYVIVVTVIMIRIITTKYYFSLHGYCRMVAALVQDACRYALRR